ncbi:hypothetical protein FBU31_005243, partial [Coemansia sp. 'formosensis']
HTGDAIAMYFDADATGAQAPDGASSAQVERRNKVIKTLCTNIESALADVKSANLKLDEANARLNTKEQELADEVQNAKIMKVRATGFKKSASELKTLNMKLEATVADQARQIDDLQKARATLGAELDEQRRVVEAMGDVRGTNEKLMRALKTERARIETQTTINRQLVDRIAVLEKTHLPPVEAGAPAAVSQGISQIDLTENGTEFESLLEDTEAVSRSIALSRPQPRHAAARRTATFELPLAAFDSDEPGADDRHNPFAAQPIHVMKFGPPSIAYFVPPGKNKLQTREPLVASKEMIQERSIRALRRPTVDLSVSDGMGGSTQYEFGGKRPNSSVQSKINWGPKR